MKDGFWSNKQRRQTKPPEGVRVEPKGCGDTCWASGTMSRARMGPQPRVPGRPGGDVCGGHVWEGWKPYWGGLHLLRISESHY